MIRKLFNLISIVMLLWTILAGAYLALPQEYKDLIPEFNWLTALVSGGSTGILGSTMLLVNNFMKKNQNSVDSKYLDLANRFLALNEKYTLLEEKVTTNTKSQVETNELLKKTNNLISIDLESKLSNPMIEDFVKEKIRGEGIGKKE
jgi:hypothetical protein